ncbi:glycosyltransferase family 9 protein [Candidatus Rhabdochlamydia porcellionis]|jgi:heptosyltransferase III|uniref:Glycosyltransferase family 9 (Heptosyltransferase) n=1 Tax=Candidatus Rhabdochlamydia porcellionis TaxID=225148 RepID=A0ABX8YZL0_9BACT|nr:glycosyltransferase family 9 protein [Candidatus Rhabdochlamydia porcellionis]QZA58804.1 Glycosyltransferase family 9 (heptosyltransferase) [Candidatus Rhabdochlamydia porcellionis]
MKKAAIICAQGLGDVLLMMIVAHQFKLSGYQTTVFHNHTKELTFLFKDVCFLPYPSLDRLEETLASFERVIIENDHSKRAYDLFRLREAKKLNNLTFFFPTTSPKFQEGDFLFDPQLPIASNICRACQTVLQIQNATKENGIYVPKGTRCRFAKRIVIHPTSNDPKRNWFSSQFLALAHRLKNEKYSISFFVSPSERVDWLHVEKQGFQLPFFSDLSQLSTYLYESGFFIGNDSGIGHLASNLGIPTLTISGNPKRVRLWRPDWHTGHIVTLPFPLPNFKGLYLPIRENFWQYFISVSRTLNAFYKLRESICKLQ